MFITPCVGKPTAETDIDKVSRYLHVHPIVQWSATGGPLSKSGSRKADYWIVNIILCYFYTFILFYFSNDV